MTTETNKGFGQQVKKFYADQNTIIPEKLEQTFTNDEGVTFMAPRGSEQADVMFVSSCPLEEEADDTNGPAFLLKGPVGAMFSRALLRCGVNIEECWYTTLIKHCLPRGQKLKPKKTQIDANKHLIEQEVKRIQPKIIICLGKVPFDFFCDYKLKLREALGGLFRSQKFDCLVYCMDDAVKVAYKPELFDRLHVDLKEIKRTINDFQGNSDEKIDLNYKTINTERSLRNWLNEVKDEKLFSVDCEWKGSNFVDGTLRYTQFCWKPGHAVCLQFYDAKGSYKFDISFNKVADILHEFFSDLSIQFCGHNIAADAVWLKNWLKIDIKKRVFFDTMYALHTVNETADLKLERLAVKFTDLGRYDIDLLLWKKKNKISQDEGYERIPDDILIPYSCKDVDVVMRTYPIITKLLVEDDTFDFFFKYKLPFVSDGLSALTEFGIPVAVEDIGPQRDLFLHVREKREELFIEELKKEAFGLLTKKLFELDTIDFNKVVEVSDHIKTKLIENDLTKNLLVYLKQQLKRDYNQIIYVAEHLVNCSNFNFNSTDDIRNWLFNVKELTPIKSTPTEDGPSVNWERVLELSENEQKNYNPSTDKNSLNIFAERGHSTVKSLLELKSVNTITRTFLRPNDESGNEEGLHKYVANDNMIHPNYSLTETDRPRTFHPNILNLPKFLTATIDNCIKNVQNFYIKNNQNIPDIIKNPKPLRWNFKAPEGWCFVESDYKTAEVFAIAFIAGDSNMISTLTEPDTQFALLPQEDDYGNVENKPVRIRYNTNTDITEDQHDSSLLFPEDDSRYLRDDQNNLIHPRRDIHWELAEYKEYMNLPREKLKKNIHRAAGKQGNFSIPYGAADSLIEWAIEIQTGQKPEEGTGEKIINAYLTKYPDVANWLENQEELVEEEGEIQSITGSKRHFHVKGFGRGLSERAYKAIVEPLKRQSRNWPIQSIVAHSLAIAVVEANDLYEQRGMQARVCIPLYDALFTLCPISEVEHVKQVHQEAMSDSAIWNFGDRKLQFELDSEVTLRWACPMDEEDQKEFNRYVA